MMLPSPRLYSMFGKAHMTGSTQDFFKADRNMTTKLLLHFHTHDAHGHSHEPRDHPGHFHERELPVERDFAQRAFTVGIGGPVGSGKTALMLQLCQGLREKMTIAVVTNDIFTKEDGEFLTKHK